MFNYGSKQLVDSPFCSTGASPSGERRRSRSSNDFINEEDRVLLKAIAFGACRAPARLPPAPRRAGRIRLRRS